MSVLYPMFLMALLTFIIGPLLIIGRFKSVQTGIVQIEFYEIFRGGESPDYVEQTTRHWSNLYEAPTLFYVLCLLILSLEINTVMLASLAWAYVIIRIIHSVVHLTYNKVYHRLSLFLTSQFMLIAMWIFAFIELM